MITLIPGGVYLYNGTQIVLPTDSPAQEHSNQFNTDAYKATMAYQIMMNHQTADGDTTLRIKFDALTSHDITYVGIIQTAIASGLDKFPIPYVLTNCHNTLAAVGGTINEDDHVFG